MRAMLVTLTLAATTSCGGDSDPIELSATFECRERPDDASGYLQPICQYLVDERGEYDIDPNLLEVESITADGDVDHVRLSCCFTGDVALMDRATRTVLGFALGDR